MTGKEFGAFASACEFRMELALERRPGNALNVEIGKPMARCSMQTPEHWPDSMGALRWIASGGSRLVFGTCRQDACPLCRCEPCASCGMKHYCNVVQPHPGGWVRCGECPPLKTRARCR